MNLSNSLRIDFTHQAADFEFHDGFNQQLIKRLRERRADKLVTFIDRGFGMNLSAPYLVSDQINLTGTSPLIGPNDPCGPRFPVINDVYLTDFNEGPLARLPKGVAAGLKPEIVPNEDELALLKSLGADFYCYNLVSSMIVAAHAGFKVIGIVIPEGNSLDHELALALSNSN